MSDRKYVFLYKENNFYSDRDCVKYIDLSDEIFECNHYFRTLHITGPCFSMQLNLDEIDFDDITSILTKKEFEKIALFNEQINQLGSGIKIGDERYLKGLTLYNFLKPIFKKLNSDKNQKLFEQVQQEEIEYLKEEYNFTDEDIDLIFDTYYLPYFDRGIVGCVYDDVEELGRQMADDMGITNEQTEKYFDFESYGQDCLDGDSYLKLSDGRIVSLNY